jgi:hypothetical protein
MGPFIGGGSPCVGITPWGGIPISYPCIYLNKKKLQYNIEYNRENKVIN